MTLDKSPTSSPVSRVLLHTARDHGVRTRYTEGEVQASKHYSNEDPPPENTSAERERTASFLQSGSQRNVSIVELEVGAREHSESEYKSEEDHEEDHVGADGAHKVYEAHYAHCHEEESYCCVSGNAR